MSRRKHTPMGKRKGIFAHVRDNRVSIKHLDPKEQRLRDITVLTLWKAAEGCCGLTLRQLKSEGYAGITAQNIALLLVLRGWCGIGWSIVNAPKRRHRGWHFATEVSRQVAELTGSEYCERFVLSHGNNRFTPCFVTKNPPKTRNVVCIDDILTTGMTLLAMRDKLQEYNVRYVVAVRNR